MRFYLVLIIFSSLLFVGTAAGNLPVNDDQAVKQKIQEWYGKVGLAGKVSEKEFEAAIRGYFHYKKKGIIPGKNIVAIVNYKIPSTDLRFFVFQIGDNAKMLREEWVAHGTNSGAPGGITTSFSNQNKSHQSSRGFYKTAETYSGKYGYSLRLDGLESGVNNNVRPRAVVLHGGRYAGYGQGGRSWGCLTVAMNRKDPVINLLKGGVLIYGSDGASHNDYTFMGGSGSVSEEDMSGVPGNDNDPGEEIDSNYVSFEDLDTFKNAESPTGNVNYGGGDFGALGTAEAIPSMAGGDPSKDEEGDNTFNEDTTNPNVRGGTAALHGTALFEECQNRASAPWEIVVAETEKPNGNPEKYFKGTWVKMNEDVKNMDQATDQVIKNMSIDNEATNEKCVALARMTKNSDFGKENSNESETYASKDGSIKCNYESAESQDYVKCKEMVDIYNSSLSAEKDMNATQLKDFKAEGQKKLDAVKANTSGVQVNASKAQKNLTTSQANIANERSRFQMAKLNTLNRLQSAMPNRNSILADCRGYMAGRTASKKYLKDYVGHLELKDKSTPSTPEPCFSVVKTMNTNLIQNIPARKQAIKAIELAGLKALDLNGKERSLLNQNLLGRGASIGNRGSKLGSQNFGGYKDKGGGKGFGFGKDVDYSKEGCLGPKCKFTGGKGSLKTGRNAGKSGFDPYSSIALPSDYASGGKNDKSKVLTFDANKKKRGVFDEMFYANIKLVMAGRLDYEDLTEEQQVEYHKLIAYQKSEEEKRRRNSSSSSRSAEPKGPIGKGSEIWFDKSMDLFEIISNRYKKVLKENKL